MCIHYLLLLSRLVFRLLDAMCWSIALQIVLCPSCSSALALPVCNAWRITKHFVSFPMSDLSSFPLSRYTTRFLTHTVTHHHPDSVGVSHSGIWLRERKRQSMYSTHPNVYSTKADEKGGSKLSFCWCDLVRRKSHFHDSTFSLFAILMASTERGQSVGIYNGGLMSEKHTQPIHRVVRHHQRDDEEQHRDWAQPTY